MSTETKTNTRAHARVFVAALLVLILAIAVGWLLVDDRDRDRTDLLPGVPIYKVQVIDQQWYDSSWWTQGLDTMTNGDLAISTGRDSSNSNSISAVHRLPYGEKASVADDVTPDGSFGEGLAVMPKDVLWQLTWTEGLAYQRRGTDMRVIEQVGLSGQGWGACYWGGNNSVVTSDGSNVLTVRDRTTMAPMHQVHAPVKGLNELDCPRSGQDTAAWAHVYPSDLLVRVDLVTGEVTGQVDLSEIAQPQRRQAKRHSDDSGAGAPNGIATIKGTEDQYYLTGKLWDAVYTVSITAGDQKKG